MEITLYSAVVCGGVLLFRLAFRRHISAALQYAVWWILIARLLFPITVESGFHFFVFPATQTQSILPAQESPVNTPQTAFSLPGEQSAQADAPDAAGTAGSFWVPAAQAWLSHYWSTAAVGVWAAGALVALAYWAVLRWQFNYNIKKNGKPAPGEVLQLVAACEKEMGIETRLPVLVLGALRSPALISSLRPRLLLPESMLVPAGEQQLEFGIRHELTHYRRRDHLTNQLLHFLRCVYWFNPVVWFAFRQMTIDMEGACDAAVTRGMGSSQRRRYMQTIIDLSSAEMPMALGMGAPRQRKTIEKRIRSMYMKRETRSVIWPVAALLAGVLLITCFTTACQPVADTTLPDATPSLAQDTPAVIPTGTPSLQPTATPAAAQDDAAQLDAAISQAVLAQVWDDSFGEKKTEGHRLLGTAQGNDGGITAYVIASYGTYGFENGVFTITSGAGAIPAVIEFSRDEQGYHLQSYTEPVDGSDNVKSTKSLFPEEYWAFVLNVGDSAAQLEEQQEQQAAAYLKSIGRDAQISSTITDRQLPSVSIGNAYLAQDKDILSDYPYWLGSREKVKDGVRTIYTLKEEKHDGYSYLTYTQSDADGKVLQEIWFFVSANGATVTKLTSAPTQAPGE